MKQKFIDLCGDWSPKHDPWGQAMSLAFDLAGEGYRRNLENILDYRPGIAGPEDIEDEYRREQIETMSDKELIDIMTYTNRVLNVLKKAGKDY